MDSRLLGGLTPARFLARHWQKAPLLVRGALPGFKDPLTPDELAGLAMEPGIHARLVEQRAGRRPWRVEHGPFPRRRLEQLPRTRWTLLVSNVEQWVEDAALLLDEFSFIPSWRLDDLMVSFAPRHGTVGPHVDSYDVFLIQGQGRRRWQIARDFDPALVQGADLGVLAKFRAEREWVLEPGDMLYLPPGVAHYGVALEDCLTYSVGFRAPAQRDLLGDLYNLPHALTSELASDALYADPNLEPTEGPGEISAATVARVAAIVKEPLERDDILGRWFAAHVTKPPPGQLPPAGRRLAPAALLKALQSGRPLTRSDAARLAYLRAPRGRLFVYANGEELPVDPGLLRLLRALCEARRHSGLALLKFLPAGPRRQAGLALLADLARRGVIYF